MSLATATDIAYSVVVPVYNEAGNLAALHERLTAVLRGLGRPYELLFVDDGSTDGSAGMLRALQAADPHVRVILLVRNFGQHPAVMAGFDAVRGEVVITLDADLQNPPEEIPKLLRGLEEGYDIATGWRRTREDPLLRRLGSVLVNKMIGGLTGVRLRDYGCMLRAYRRQAVEHLKRFPEKHKFLTVLTSWLHLRIVEVEVEQAARHSGSSKYTLAKLVRLNFDLLTGFSTTPIHVVSLLGFAMSALGFALGFFFLVDWLVSGASAVGMAAFFSAVLFLGGMQLLALGMVGEYVARIFVQVQARPYYLVKEVLESGSGTPPGGPREVARGEAPPVPPGTPASS